MCVGGGGVQVAVPHSHPHAPLATKNVLFTLKCRYLNTDRTKPHRQPSANRLMPQPETEIGRNCFLGPPEKYPTPSFV